MLYVLSLLYRASRAPARCTQRADHQVTALTSYVLRRYVDQARRCRDALADDCLPSVSTQAIYQAH